MWDLKGTQISKAILSQKQRFGRLTLDFKFTAKPQPSKRCTGGTGTETQTERAADRARTCEVKQYHSGAKAIQG